MQESTREEKIKKRQTANPTVGVIGVSVASMNQTYSEQNSFGIHPLNENLMLRGSSMNNRGTGLGLISVTN